MNCDECKEQRKVYRVRDWHSGADRNLCLECRAAMQADPVSTPTLDELL